MQSEVFFDFRSKSVLSYFRAPPIDQNIRTDDLIKGDYKNIVFPVEFKQSGGSKICDLIAAENPRLFLISDKFRNVLHENKISGWRACPIKLFDKKNNEISGYSGFSITGRCAELSFKNSEVIEKKLVPQGPICKFYKGVKIVSWDGSDFILPRNSLQIIVNRKTTKLVKQYKLSNIQLENLKEREINMRLVN